MIKSLIPHSFKLPLRLVINTLQDIRLGYNYATVNNHSVSYHYTNKVTITQALKPNDAKLHNLDLAIKNINAVHIKPNEVFSFWKIIGSPTKKSGYKESRSIVNNQIVKSIGGGLCQLSGMIYYLSLQTDLPILERHNHSIDIYTEETRYTPLGSDATVAYGYKDLKVKNPFSFPIRFLFELGKETITIHLQSTENVPTSTTEFKHYPINTNQIKVETFVNHKIRDISLYKKLI